MVEFLVLSVLAFFCIALFLSTLLLWRSGTSQQQILKVFGIICIIAISAVLVLVEHSNDQLTPVIGLFGAIAGYLLGKETSSVKPRAASDKDKTQA